MKKLVVLTKLAVTFGLAFFHSNAYADGQLMVMPARTTIEGLQPNKVQVSNLGDMPLYLNIDLVHVENPGQLPEIKTSVGNLSTPELMVSPAKLTLGPGQKRDLSLVALKTPGRETLYRLYIVPVSSIKVLGSEKSNKITAPLTFGVAYGVVVHHLPTTISQTHGWNHQCVSEGIKLTVTGSVSSKFVNLEGNPEKSLSREEKVFPGTPRTFPVKRLKGNADGQPFEIYCP